MTLLEKASLADQVAKLEEEVRRLNSCVGALSLENASVSKRMAELEVDLVVEKAAKGVLEKDVLWNLGDGFSRVVDRVIESPQFLHGLVQVRATCVVAGVDQGKRAVK